MTMMVGISNNFKGTFKILPLLITGYLPRQGSQGKVREFTLPLEKSGKSQGI